MTAATFGGEETVLDDKGKTSTYEAITSGFRFSSDITRDLWCVCVCVLVVFVVWGACWFVYLHLDEALGRPWFC